MVRLADLPEWERAHMLGKIPALPAIGLAPWVAGGPLARRRVALVTSAGVHRRGDRPRPPLPRLPRRGSGTSAIAVGFRL